jgi:trehalose 6-phosphate phosphatase
MNSRGPAWSPDPEVAVDWSSPDEVVDALAQRCGDRRRLVLGVDLDGTLAAIVDHARAARLWPGALQALLALDERDDVEVVVVTGRARADAITTFGLPRALRVVGSHGHEHHDGNSHPWGGDTAALDELEIQARRIASRDSGAWVERKPHSVVLHVRTAAIESRQSLLDAYREIASEHDWTILDGSAVLEAGVAPLDKSAAMENLRCEFDATSMAFFGDDVTDEQVFRRLGDQDVAIKIGPGPSVARFRLAGPADVVGVLDTLGGRP